MTVASETSISGPYAFNGAAVLFNYTFRILDASELAVVAVDDATGEMTVLGGYSVSGGGDAGGGTITFSVAPAGGQTGYALRDTDLRQLILLNDVGPFQPETLMRGLDRAMMAIQQLKEVQARSVVMPPGEEGSIPSRKANAFLATGSDKRLMWAAGVAGAPVSSEIAPLLQGGVDDLKDGLALGSMADQDAAAVEITGGSISGVDFDNLDVGDDPNIDGSAPGGIGLNVTKSTSGLDGVVYGEQIMLDINAGNGPGEEARATYRRTTISTDEPVNKAVVASDYLYITGNADCTGDSIFAATHQGLHFGTGEIAVLHGSFNTCRLEDGAGGYIGIGRGATNSALAFAAYGGGATGFFDTAQGSFNQCYVDGDAKIGSAMSVVASYANDGGATDSVYLIRTQFSNNGAIAGDVFGSFVAARGGSGSIGGVAWGYYEQGSDPNFFNGLLRIGDTDDWNAKLQVEQGTQSNALVIKRQDAGAVGPIVNFIHDSSSPAASDVVYSLRGTGRNSVGDVITYSEQRVRIIDTSSGNEQGALDFYTYASALTRRGYFALGLVLGSPTGGDKGTGSINAQNVYDDNVLLSCYPLEQWITGQIDVAKWDARVPDRVVEGRPAQKRAKMQRVLERQKVIELIEGRPVEVEREVEVEKPVTETKVVLDGDGRPVLEEIEPARLVPRRGRDGKLMRNAAGEPLETLVPPVLREKTIELTVLEDVPAVPDEVIPRRHEPLRHFLARLGTEYDPMTIEGQIKHVRDKRHLTPFPNEDKFDPQNPLEVGSWVQRFMEMAELQFIYTAQLHAENRALMARVEALEQGRS